MDNVYDSIQCRIWKKLEKENKIDAGKLASSLLFRDKDMNEYVEEGFNGVS